MIRRQLQILADSFRTWRAEQLHAAAVSADARSQAWTDAVGRCWTRLLPAAAALVVLLVACGLLLTRDVPVVLRIEIGAGPHPRMEK